MSRFYDSEAALRLLRNLERSEADDKGEIKLALLLSKAQRLVGEGFTATEALREMRKLNAASKPGVSDAELSSRIAAFIRGRLKGYEREGEIPRSAGSMFREAEAQAEAHRGLEPVRLHIPALDGAIGGGFFPGHVLGIVGHEGSLKSSVALHVAERNVWENPAVRCLFFSLDMTPEMMAFRRISRYLGVHESIAREMASAGAREYAEAKREIERLDDGRFLFAGGPLTLQGMETAFDAALPNLVLIDYISLIIAPDETDQFKTLRKAIDGIRKLRDQTKTTFILLSQMGRASKAAAKAGQTGSHAFGGSIVEHVLDVEIELVLDEPINEEDQKRLIATITKSRFGPAGTSFEVEYQGIAKKITGRAWRLQRSTKAKPMFGERVSLWNIPNAWEEKGGTE